MYRTDNPVLDAERYYSDMEAARAQLPRCSCCGYPIDDDTCFKIDGYIYCEDCLKAEFEVNTEDLIEDAVSKEDFMEE